MRILQIRQKWCTIRASKAKRFQAKVKRKNTRAPCRIRREGITCRGVVPFVFRRRRDVLFFSFFLKKTRRGSGRLVFLFFRRGGRQPSGNSYFLLPPKESSKENCRCFDAADPRPRGCTPLGTPKRKSEGAGATRTQYYCSRLTPPPLPPLLSRVFPRTPVTLNFPSDCRGRPCPARSLASAPGFALCPLVCYIVGRGLDPSATFR